MLKNIIITIVATAALSSHAMAQEISSATADTIKAGDAAFAIPETKTPSADHVNTPATEPSPEAARTGNTESPAADPMYFKTQKVD